MCSSDLFPSHDSGGGKVVVDNVTSESITLRYDDFKFTKNGGEYTIKGRVLYHKN